MKPVTTTDDPVGRPEHGGTLVPGEAPGERQPAQLTPTSGIRRVVWFLFIWVCSVAALAVVAGVIRWFVKP